LFSTTGELLRTIGTKGQRSDTGVPPDDMSSGAYRKVTHGGGPFNLPTDIDLTPSGEMFITDGYGNARVHKFAADGTDLFSWGSRAMQRDSLTYRMASGLISTGVCWWRTARTTASRSLTRTASCCRSGPRP